MSAPAASSPPLPGSLTLRAVCDLPLMAGVKVLAGSAGLGRFVSRLNVMTVPDIARWTKSHELLLTTGYPLRGGRLDDLVKELDGRGVTGLAVKLDRYLEQLPDAALEAAERADFPLLAIPTELAFDDILSVVLSEIANRQAQTLMRARQVHDVLLRASLAGGLEAVVGELSRTLDWPGVWCVDHRDILLAESCATDLREDLERRDLVDDERLHVEALLGGEPERVASIDLPVSDVVRGRLVVLREGPALDEQEQMMLEQAAMVAALCISKSSAVVAVNRRFRSNALHSLLLGRPGEMQEVATNAGSFGWDLRRPMRVVVAKPSRQPDLRARDAALAAWESLVTGADPQAAAATMGPTFVAICAADADAPPGDRAWWDRAAEQLPDICEVDVAIGISDVVEAHPALAAAWSHAVTAADFTMGRFASLAVRMYDDLGVLRLVDSVGNQQRVQEYLNETLGPVLALDGRQRQDLLETLDALFAHNLNVAETARAMHFHYNTLRFRVRKLEELVGPFTQDLRLAVRIGVALEVSPLSTDSP